MKKRSVFQNVRKALVGVGKNLNYTFFSIACDVLFFIIFAIVFFNIQQKILGYLYKLVEIVQTDIDQISGFIADQSNVVDLLVQNPEFVYNLGEAFRWLAILMVVVYMIWGFFQGLAWLYCMRIVDKQWEKVYTYIVRFFLVNLVWVSLFYAFVYTWVRLSVYSMFSLFPVLSQDFITGLFLSSTLALTYFALVSYPLLRTTDLNQILQKTLLFGIAKYRKLVPMYLLVLGALVTVGIMYFFLVATNSFVLFLMVTAFVVIPLLTVIRVFVSLTVAEN